MYTKWPQNFPNDHKICIPTFSIVGLTKTYPNWYFWFENIPSGNPALLLIECKIEHIKLAPQSNVERLNVKRFNVKQLESEFYNINPTSNDPTSNDPTSNNPTSNDPMLNNPTSNMAERRMSNIEHLTSNVECRTLC
jgi:hypothetical protein